MTDRSIPPVKRFRTKIDMRRVEYEESRAKKASVRRRGLVMCQRCQLVGESILIKVRLADGHAEQLRCEKCLHNEPKAVEILRWGTET